MMKRRTFLKLTGIAMTGQALGAASFVGSPVASFGTVPSASAAVLPPVTSTRRIAIAHAGSYQISGLVRLQAPTVEISGITNSQQISWSSTQGEAPLVSFTSQETYDRPGLTPEIHVLGGRIESVTATPLMLS
jgi:hypothetical protein